MNQESTAVPKTPAYAWAIVFALYMVTLSATLNLFKVPPLMVPLNNAFNVTFVETGDLMGIFSVMGFVLAIPAGFILKKLGIKITALISVAAVAIGPALGALAVKIAVLFFGKEGLSPDAVSALSPLLDADGASKAFTILYASRFIEGIGMGLIMVTAPLAISIWFPLQKTSLPTGVWATSVGIGNIVMLFIAPSLAVSYNWQLVWWICAGFSALSFIIFAIMFRMPSENEMEPAPAPPPETAESAPAPPSGEEVDIDKNLLRIVGVGFLGAVILSIAGFLYPKILGESFGFIHIVSIGWIVGILIGFILFPVGANRSFWMIGIAFGCYNLVVMAVTNVYPSYLMEFKNFLPTYDNGVLMHASFVTAFVFGASIITSPIGGWISDTIGKRKIMVIIPFALLTLTFLFPFNVDGGMIPLYTLVFGIMSGPLAAVLLASVPEVAKKPQFIGIGMAIAIFLQNIGMFVAGILFPRIQEAYVQTAGLQESWAIAGYWMIPFGVLGIIATLFVKVR